MRFMGDVPEPSSSDSISVASSVASSHPLPGQQPRRLSLLVGLDEVSFYVCFIITLKKNKKNDLPSNYDVTSSGQKILRRKKKFGNRKASAIPEEVVIIQSLCVCVLIHNAYCIITIFRCCHHNQPENLTEDEDVMIGERVTLHRPLSDLEKLHVITRYALSKPDIW